MKKLIITILMLIAMPILVIAQGIPGHWFSGRTLTTINRGADNETDYDRFETNEMTYNNVYLNIHCSASNKDYHFERVGDVIWKETYYYFVGYERSSEEYWHIGFYPSDHMLILISDDLSLSIAYN